MSGVRIGVVGAGLMGTAIAQVLAAADHEVDLFDPSEDARHRAAVRIREIFERLGQPTAGARHVTLHKELKPAVTEAAYVFEAGPEKLPVKQEIFARLSQFAPSDAILASNTSAIPIREIGAHVTDRGRVVGAHFWNPPYAIKLVEVVQSDATTAEAVAATIQLLDEAKMKPVHVRVDTPGFVGNRLQHALKREAIALVAAGVCDAETVDTVVKHGFGRRLATLGPLEQSDLVGLDLTLDIHRTLMPALDNTPEPHPYLVERVEHGDLGMKTGHGFRHWTTDEAQTVRERFERELLEIARHRDRPPGT